MLVGEVSNLERLCTVLADYARSLDNIVILKEIKSAVVLNVNNLNVTNIVSKRIDKVNSRKRILVSASLVKKSRLYAKLLVLIHLNKLLFNLHANLCSCLFVVTLMLELSLTAIIVLEIR